MTYLVSTSCQANAQESLGWISHQSALLKHFIDGMDSPNQVTELEKKMAMNKALYEEKIKSLSSKVDRLSQERNDLKATNPTLKIDLYTSSNNFGS
jgi:hypothetical protein